MSQAPVKETENQSAAKKNGTLISQIAKSNPLVFQVLKPGDLVEGKIAHKSSRLLIVDLGRHGTGAVYGGELQNSKSATKGLKEGDSIHGKVINPDNEEGYIELSLTEAGKQKSWTAITELKEKDEVITVKPTNANRGGLMVEIEGLMAFLPVSQLSNEHYPKVENPADDKNEIMQALQKLVGTELSVKIIDVNPRTNKFILSEREATQVSIKELAKNYTVGQVIEGIVSGIADFGVFVRFTDNPLVEGLVHISELDHRMVDNPKEIVNVDDTVTAKIIDLKDGKIALSIKALKTNPWDTVLENYKENEEVSGVIYSFNPFGAVASLDNDIQGYIHVSEFGSIEEMKKKLTLKERYTFTITSIKPQEKRITLKLKK